MIKPACLTLLLCASLLSCNNQKVSTGTYHRAMPYPESDLIEKLVFTSEPMRYPGSGSDMHWWTWGVDDAVYVLDDDGKNFGGPINYAHVLKVTGIPPDHQVETVTDFMEIPFRKMTPKDKLLSRYVDGIIAVDSLLYVSIYDYDWDIERTKPYFDSIKPRLEFYDYFEGVQDSTMFKHMNFASMYSKNYGIAGIIKSTDFGKTWTNVPTANTPRFLGPKFAGLTFLNFGPGYSDVPEHLSPFVYAMSNDGSWETGDHVFMARVHKDSILNRNAWQFLAGIENNVPRWSASEDKCYPVFTDPGHTAHPTISYNKALKRYILGMYSDVVPHREDASDEEWRKWDKVSEMQLYESEHPWGPWKIFHNEKPWGGTRHAAYLPQIPNKWWSKDGLSGTMLFAGDYTHNQKHHEWYGFMTQLFTLKLKK
ncbi:MAG TPA: DUF4185 domain-containing protein [Flavisolibacter sp.]|nr:DUF4185 domain-containing protein [Flavisolibacter sp.]